MQRAGGDHQQSFAIEKARGRQGEDEAAQLVDLGPPGGSPFRGTRPRRRPLAPRRAREPLVNAPSGPFDLHARRQAEAGDAFRGHHPETAARLPQRVLEQQSVLVQDLPLELGHRQRLRLRKGGVMGAGAADAVLNLDQLRGQVQDLQAERLRSLAALGGQRLLLRLRLGVQPLPQRSLFAQQ